MKRILVSILAVGMLAAQVSADMYVLDAATAMQFVWEVPDGGGDDGDVRYGPTSDLNEYKASMQGQVGWVGWLEDQGGDDWALMVFGVAGTEGPAGSYDGFQAFLANDDDDPWSVGLFVQFDGNTYINGNKMYPGLEPVVNPADFHALDHGENVVLTVDAPNGVNFVFGEESNVEFFGFALIGQYGAGVPSNPDFFHISAVHTPLPGAVLLGMLGLGVAGWRLRESA